MGQKQYIKSSSVIFQSIVHLPAETQLAKLYKKAVPNFKCDRNWLRFICVCKFSAPKFSLEFFISKFACWYFNLLSFRLDVFDSRIEHFTDCFMCKIKFRDLVNLANKGAINSHIKNQAQEHCNCYSILDGYNLFAFIHKIWKHTIKQEPSITKPKLNI